MRGLSGHVLLVARGNERETHASAGNRQGRFGTLISMFYGRVPARFACCGAGARSGRLPVAVAGFMLTALAIMALGMASTFAVRRSLHRSGVGAISLNTAGNTLIPVVLLGSNPAAASNRERVLRPWTAPDA